MKPNYEIIHRGFEPSRTKLVFVYNWKYSNTIDMAYYASTDFKEIPGSEYCVAIFKLKTLNKIAC